MKNVFLALIMFTSCASVSLQEKQVNEIANQTPQTIEKPETTSKPEKIISNIPKATWEKIYFEGINEWTTEAGLESLRKTVLAENDLEFRLWMGFGLTKLEGFIMKRIENEWSAIYVDADYISENFISRNIKLNEPKSGWGLTWQKLVENEILTLPDAATINCNAGANDGTSFVVE